MIVFLRTIKDQTKVPFVKLGRLERCIDVWTVNLPMNISPKQAI